jgi:hypothetical protein
MCTLCHLESLDLEVAPHSGVRRVRLSRSPVPSSSSARCTQRQTFIADRGRLGVRSDGSGGAVDGHDLPGMQASGGVAGGDDGGDSVFARYQGGVRSQAAAVSDDGGSSSEQGRPCRGGDFCDKHVAVAEPAEVLRALHDPYRSASASLRCRVPDDDVLANFSLATGLLHGAADHIPDQPNRLPERQGRGEVALPLPQVAPLTHEVNNRLPLPRPKAGGHFVAVAEEHIIGLFDRTDRDHVFAQPADTNTQDRPAKGEVAGLFLSDDRVPLADLQQLLELGE